ncbi:hypothetical protein Tsp_04136, partial [Trichinella spiralis]|uniref:hypothetical protein n=1 Tax=Trichinella spiralis TaxID=6334 RepID=UPI0001EFB760
LRYANNDRHKRCLIVSKGALVRLTYVASGSTRATRTKSRTARSRTRDETSCARCVCPLKASASIANHFP